MSVGSIILSTIVDKVAIEFIEINHYFRVMKRLLPLICFLVLSSVVVGQDTLQLLNGKTKLIEVISEDYDHLRYRELKKNGELGRKRKKSTDHIFAIVYKDSVTSQVYRKDSLMENYWTVSEMKFYLEGRRQARKHFRPYKTFLLGLAVGSGTALYGNFPIVISEKDQSVQVYDTISGGYVTINSVKPTALAISLPYWEIIPLSAFVYGASRITNDKAFKADDQAMFQNRMFVLGYKETVINRQTYAAAGSSLGSLILVKLSYLFFDPALD